MGTHKSRRAVRATKQVDESIMRQWIAKMLPTTTALGVVRKFPGESSHFDIDTDPDTGKQTVFVDVELVPSSERVLCKLGFGNDQIFKIPRENQEVAVLIPASNTSLIKDGLEFDPIIVGVIDQEIPAQLDGDDVVVITAPRVIMAGQSLIQLGTTAVELATKADVQAVRDDLDGHTHLYVPYPGGVAGTPVATTGNPSVTAPTGTSVVKGQ